MRVFTSFTKTEAVKDAARDRDVQIATDMIQLHRRAVRLAEKARAAGIIHLPTDADRAAVQSRMNILSALLQGPNRDAIVPIVALEFPDLFPTDGEA